MLFAIRVSILSMQLSTQNFPGSYEFEEAAR
jgi:hypothetical protein